MTHPAVLFLVTHKLLKSPAAALRQEEKLFLFLSRAAIASSQDQLAVKHGMLARRHRCPMNMIRLYAGFSFPFASVLVTLGEQRQNTGPRRAVWHRRGISTYGVVGLWFILA